MLYLSRDDVESLLTPQAVIEACEEALRLEAEAQAENVPRFHIYTDVTDLRFMPAHAKAKGYVGLRVYNVGGAPIRLTYILWDRKGEPVCMMDAMWIRDLRTGAIGAIGARHLARPESATVGILGSGRQARSSLIAHAQLFKFQKAKVFSPNHEHRESYARELGERLKLEITPVDSKEEAARDVDIIITGSSQNSPADPILLGSMLKSGMHVSAIGGRAEMDDTVVTTADKVVIDSKPQFEYESYDVTEQVKKGLISWDQVSELHEVVAKQKPGRQRTEEITVLKTVGTALQDLLPAIKAYELAREKGAGRDLGELFPGSGGWYAGAR